MAKTPPGKWGLHQISALLGTSAPSWGRYLNGLSYPTLQMMQKIEVVMGWPVTEQVQLIPYYWEWPHQAKGPGQVTPEPTDLRYGMKLRQVANEWGEANPRTVESGAIRQHPATLGGRKRYELSGQR
jgi:hypothetical protein